MRSCQAMLTNMCFFAIPKYIVFPSVPDREKQPLATPSACSAI